MKTPCLPAKRRPSKPSPAPGCAGGLFPAGGGHRLFALKLYTDKLFRPIYEITQNLKAVRQGNLNRKSSVRSNDELGALCEEFNNMTQRLLEFERSTMGQLLSERNRTMAIVRSITEPLGHPGRATGALRYSITRRKSSSVCSPATAPVRISFPSSAVPAFMSRCPRSCGTRARIRRRCSVSAPPMTPVISTLP